MPKTATTHRKQGRRMGAGIMQVMETMKSQDRVLGLSILTPLASMSIGQLGLYLQGSETVDVQVILWWIQTDYIQDGISTYCWGFYRCACFTLGFGSKTNDWVHRNSYILTDHNDTTRSVRYNLMPAIHRGSRHYDQGEWFGGRTKKAPLDKVLTESRGRVSCTSGATLVGRRARLKTTTLVICCTFLKATKRSQSFTAYIYHNTIVCNLECWIPGPQTLLPSPF